MIRIELSDEDAMVLRQALNLYLAEFRREVAGTENPEFRHGLQRTQGILERVAGALDPQAA